MDKNTIIEKLRKLIYDYLDDEPEFNEDSLLNEDLGLSSLDLISVVGDIEDTFGIVIDDNAVPSIKTVGDVIEYISSKVN